MKTCWYFHPFVVTYNVNQKPKKMRKQHVLLPVLLFLCTVGISQTQLGNDIDGTQWSSFGSAIALANDGHSIAIGAHRLLGAGGVRVYDWDGTTWQQRGADLLGDVSDEYFGLTVDLSSDGNILAVGAPFSHVNGEYSGYIRIFEWDGAVWTQLGDDLIGPREGEEFGDALALSGDGDILAVGSPYYDEFWTYGGVVRTYEWSGTTWQQKGQNIYAEGDYDLLGYSVGLSDNGQILGAGAVYGGYVKIFEWEGDAWEQIGDSFAGREIDLSADGMTVVVGDEYNDDNGDNAGQVRVHRWDGASWNQLGEPINGDVMRDLLGASVAISSDGNRIVAGAPSDGYGDHYGLAGYTQVFEWDGSTWQQLGATIIGEDELDFSGAETGISSNGQIVATGSTENDGGGLYSGHVRVFDLSGLSSTIQIGAITLEIAPNPVKDILHIIGQQPEAAQVFDQQGRQMIHLDRSISEIDFSALPSGWYVLRVQLGGKLGTVKVLKQ
jgi:hypothetical protein